MFELNSKEKAIMYQLQAIIPKENVMTDSILRDLINILAESKKDDINLGGLQMRVQTWWQYVGQWNWPQTSVSRNKSLSIAERIIQNNTELLNKLTIVPRKKDLGLRWKDHIEEVTTAQVKTTCTRYSLYFQYVPWDGTEEGKDQILKDMGIDPEERYTFLAYGEI